MRKKHILLGLCLCGMLCLLCGCDSADYKNANQLLEEGNFQEARRIYLKLEGKGGYEDSAAKLLECDYVEAGEACEAGDFDQAQKLYKGLMDYDDERAAEGLLRVAYGRGRQYMESGGYVEAVAAFSAAGDYEDSEALIAECAAALMEDPQVGDPVFFGAYTAEGDSESRPIQWRVLARNGDDLLLLSEFALEAKQFGSNGYWDKCELREWLNGDFYGASFSEEEKASIQKMMTSNITEDNVFLLSWEEAGGLLPGPEDRIAYSTSRGKQYWWLRSVDTEAIAGRCWGCVTMEGALWDYEQYSRLLSSNKENFYYARPVVCISLSGKPEEAAQNMSLFGYDSNIAFGTRVWAMDMNYTLKDTRLGSWAPESSGGGSCPACGGTGAIRYNYGSSDLEAWLSGHDAYTIGKCTMCGGSGKV